MTCKECAAPLKPLDVSFTMKLISRGATSYLCQPCLCKKFGYTQSQLDKLAEEWKKQGCTLFL